MTSPAQSDVAYRDGARSGPAHARHAPPASDPRRWWGLAVIALAQLMVVLDMTVVNIALPHAQDALHISTADRQWMVTAYTLAFGGLLLLGGRVSDLVGRKRMFLIGLIGFGVASAVGGAAVNAAMLFASRAVQGGFAALLAPAALSLLTTTFTDPRERGKAFGIYGAIAGGGSAVGLIAGGLLTEYINWRWCMYVNVPIAVLAGLGAAFLVHGGKPENPDRKLDFPGVILASGGLVSLVYGFTEAESRGWGDRRVLSLLIGAAVLLILFVLVEWRSKRPMLPLHVVADRNRAGAFLAVGLATIGMFGVFLFLTYFLQVNKGYSPVRTGLAFLPMTAAIVTAATQISARLMTRVPARFLLGPGLLLAAGGLAMLLRLKVDSGYTAVVLPAELMLGFGMGLVFMPAMSTATSGVAPRDAGVTSATVNTAQQVGGSIGTALLNTIAASAATRYIIAHRLFTPGGSAVGVVHGYTVAVAWAAGIMVLAALLAMILINARPAGRATVERAPQAPAEPRPEPAAQPLPEPMPESVPEPTAEAEPVGPALHGRVLRTDARPLSSAVLTLIEPGGRQVGRTTVDAGGGFRLPTKQSGQYVLLVSAPNHRPEATTITVNGQPRSLDVRLAPASGLTGVVRYPGASTGVPSAVAVLTDPRGEVAGSATTDAAGRYTFDSVPAGEYTLALSHPDHEPLATLVSVAEDGVSVHDVELPATTEVSGVVRDTAAEPVKSALVTLIDGDGNVVGSVLTDEQGRYRLSGVRTGAYTIVASGYAPTTDTVTLPTADGRHRDLVLSHQLDG